MKDQDQQLPPAGDAYRDLSAARGEVIEGLSFGAAGLACAGARVLVPGHLDEELSTTQGSELRAHLLDCPSCREVLKQETHLRRWFSAGAPEAVPVPAGFSARVARLAFEGDPGISYGASEPQVSTGQQLGLGLDPGLGLEVGGASPAGRKRGSLLAFILGATAVAAAALFLFAVLLQGETLPQGERLDAFEYTPPWERAAAPLAGASELPGAVDPLEAGPLEVGSGTPELGGPGALEEDSKATALDPDGR